MSGAIGIHRVDGCMMNSKRVHTGLEVLLEWRRDLLQEKRVGMIVNPTSVNADLEHAADLMRAPDVALTTLFGPQHGIRGETQDNMIEWEGYLDSATGVRVYSLYGQTRIPTPDMLSNLDVLIFDVQDVGARYYTFIYTMTLAMQACARAGKEFIVLDRPNPINGRDVEGPPLERQFASFVGLYPLPHRHGLTVGEVARYINAEEKMDCRLEVVQMQGWRRPMWFDQTGLPWVIPSPNMPTLDTAIVYPGMCLVEGTMLSEGRGTTRPFELVGAPWADAMQMAARLHRVGLPGIRFRPASFLPTFQKHASQMCHGVQLHVTDRDSFKPFLTGIAVIQQFYQFDPRSFRWKDPPYEYEYEKLPIDILLGSDRLRLQLVEGVDVWEMERGWQSELDEFRDRRETYLLY